MKKQITRIIVTIALLTITAATTGEALSASSGATCYGRTPCRACKTCEYCKFCAVKGGTCGVCKK